jgi:hypothetical protein
VNETTRQTLLYTLDDLKNQLRIDQQHLEQAIRDVVSFQAKVNQGEYKIAELNTTLAKMDGEK